MAKTKVYTDDEIHGMREASKGLYGRPGTFATEGNELYVLIRAADPDYAQWLHPTEGLVNLYNTHGTGELRWDVRSSRVGGDDLVAVLHYGLSPADMSPEDWRKELLRHRFTMAQLSAEEQELFRRVDRDGDGTVTSPPDTKKQVSAIWDAMHKGLVYMTGQASGGGRPGTTTFYKLTAKGRRLRAGKSNPGRTRVRRRARTPSAQMRARNDRLRRIMRGI